MDTYTASDTVRHNVIRLCQSADRPAWRISYAALARRLGWSRQRLSKLLNTDKIVTVEELLALAVALDVAPATLITPSEGAHHLEVRANDQQSWVLDRSETLGWVAGIPADARLGRLVGNVDRYFEEVGHTKVHNWHARRWFQLVEHTKISDDDEATMPQLGED